MVVAKTHKAKAAKNVKNVKLNIHVSGTKSKSKSGKKSKSASLKSKGAMHETGGLHVRISSKTSKKGRPLFIFHVHGKKITAASAAGAAKRYVSQHDGSAKKVVVHGSSAKGASHAYHIRRTHKNLLVAKRVGGSRKSSRKSSGSSS